MESMSDVLSGSSVEGLLNALVAGSAMLRTMFVHSDELESEAESEAEDHEFALRLLNPIPRRHSLVAVPVGFPSVHCRQSLARIRSLSPYFPPPNTSADDVSTLLGAFLKREASNSVRYEKRMYVGASAVSLVMGI